jgi:aspartate-semialdehyde dehydrogenase
MKEVVILNKEFKVGILGATGIVGQQYIALLQNHPWFRITFLAASKKSSGQLYGELIKQRGHFLELNEELNQMTIFDVMDIERAKENCDFVFSALSGDQTKEIEQLYAKNGFGVVSNTSAHRKDPLVPLLIPEINASHLDIIPEQQKAYGWEKGFIVVKSNCSIQSFILPLFLLEKAFGVERVITTTVQAISGAGHPGTPSLDILGNIIPFISGEEEKTESEPLKILGEISDKKIKPTSSLVISSQCMRGPVIDGHLASVSFSLKTKTHLESIKKLLQSYCPQREINELPSSPNKTLIFHESNNFPQPRKHVNMENGMAFHVGRLRECPILDYKFIGLSHNTIRGAAGGGIYNAELLAQKGFFSSHLHARKTASC